MNILIRFVMYGAIGVLMEVLWTGVWELYGKNFRLTSTTSLWMFFIYGMVVVIEPVFRLLSPINFIMRGIVYAVIILTGEFITGSLLKHANVCPWDYSNTKYHVRGVIRLDYIPAWAAAGLIFEQIYWVIVK